MKHITWIGPIDIIPVGEDETGELKELVLADPESGEVIHYKMTQELADKLARKMKAKNSYLVDEIQRAQARARLEVPGMPGNGGVPISPEVAAELRRQSGG